jgi:hypothetical protein
MMQERDATTEIAIKKRSKEQITKIRQNRLRKRPIMISPTSSLL